MEVRPARIKPRPEPAMGNPPRLQRVGRHCRKRKREEGGGRGRAAPVAACTWPWRRSGGGGVGRCSSRRPRQATTWCHLPPTPAASCCGCWQWRSESPTLPPPLLAVRPSFRPWRRRPPASAGSARWQATTTATSASKTPGLCWNIFGHCLINFTELLNTIDLCGNRWSISRMYKKQSASVHARALKKVAMFGFSSRMLDTIYIMLNADNIVDLRELFIYLVDPQLYICPYQCKC
uniref:Uncharacterized protein n=1 Tax=Triticum urartu TaxID=4572 RepID=A0A8R7QCY2_TRIUA